MSELQPDNFPHTGMHALANFEFDPAPMMQAIEQRATDLNNFFRTELGAFSLFQSIGRAQTDNYSYGIRSQRDTQGTMYDFPPIEYRPDPEQSDQYRFIDMSLMVVADGPVPVLRVYRSPEDQEPEVFMRHELLIARAALKGSIMRFGGKTDVIGGLLGGDPAVKQELLARQQRYAHWIERAALASGVSPMRRFIPFAPKHDASAQ